MSVAIVTVVVMLVVVALLVTVPAWLLWNWLMPDLFGLPSLSIVQAFGVVILCRLLFAPTSSSGGSK